MPSRSFYVKSEPPATKNRVRSVDPGDPTTWPPARRQAAEAAMATAARALYVSASEFDQVTAMIGQPIGVVDDVLVLARLAAEELERQPARRLSGGAA